MKLILASYVEEESDLGKNSNFYYVSTSYMTCLKVYLYIFDTPVHDHDTRNHETFQEREGALPYFTGQAIFTYACTRGRADEPTYSGNSLSRYRINRE